MHDSCNLRRTHHSTFASMKTQVCFTMLNTVFGADRCMSYAVFRLADTWVFGKPSVDHPYCVTCQCSLTVKHTLIECTHLSVVLNKKYFVASSMRLI